MKGRLSAIAVMHQGKLLETLDSRSVRTQALHPQTIALLDAVLSLQEARRKSS